MRLFTRKTNNVNKKYKLRISIRDMSIFAALGAIMFASKIAMQSLPNVHLLAMFIAAFTLVYRVRALIPIYIYIMLDGLFVGFAFWWVPYLYIWIILWAWIMLVSKIKFITRNKKRQVIVYMFVCGLHGLSFGTLYAPFQAFVMGYNFKVMLAWIIAGLPFDITHAISDCAAGSLVVPLVALLERLEKGRA